MKFILSHCGNIDWEEEGEEDVTAIQIKWEEGEMMGGGGSVIMQGVDCVIV